MTNNDLVLNEMVAVLDSHGPRFAGNHVEDMAQEWLDYDFTPEQADEWCSIGVWNAATAAEFRDAGLSPDQVQAAAERLLDAEQAAWTDERWGYSRYTDGCPIYSICNGDTDAAVIINSTT